MTTTYRPDDPLYSIQWHFSLIGRLGFDTGNNTAGIERVWGDYTGTGMHVGIWDSGTQAAHWDLAPNYDSSRHVTINGTLNNGQPLTADDGHGTSVGGLIAAADNDLGGVGVAFDANITGIRIFGGQDDINSYWSRYLLTLDHLSDFDVTNHSYGAYPSFYTWGDIAKFEAAAENGRGGLGTVNVKSAGNSDVDGNGSALDASRFTVTVAALSANGQVTYYSTYGAHVLVSAPAGSVTTDMLANGWGYDGLLDGDYTNRFGGTSAAGPITAGVITLMLDANEGLGWRDVQNILSYSAAGTGSLYTGVTTYEDSAWQWNGADNWNGGGLHFSEDYGYGMVNAFNAVRMAEIWSIVNPAAQTSANEAVATTGTIATNQTIADLSTLNYSFTVNQDISLEHVGMTVGLTHSYFTDLTIRLISPENTVMTLYDGSTGSSYTSDYGFSYTFGLDGFRGESSAGTWTLQIQDNYGYDSGVLTSVNFTGYGSTLSTNDTYHYTDEVLTVLEQTGQGGRVTLADSDGGTDWIDAAAMYRDLYLDLRAGNSSTLAGTVFLTVEASTAIENAIAGDGNDYVVGNELDNLIYGMRGNDTLNGGSGVDTAAFIGCLADYQITYAEGITTVTCTSGLYGVDTLVNFEFLKFEDQTIIDPSSGYVPPPDETAPTLLTSSPSDDATSVRVTANIVLTFNEDVKAGSGNVVVYNSNGGVWNTIDITDTSQVTFSGATVTINPTANLAYETGYYVLIDGTAITDLSENAFAGISNTTALNFTTSSNTITGTNGADTLYGTDVAEIIYGLDGNDRLYGYGGNDTIYGGNGYDIIYGGDGDDTLDGGAYSDALYGGNGNDVLDGGSSADYMAGENGDDTYYVDNTYDIVSEYSNGGNDTVLSSIGFYSLSSYVENLTFTGSGDFTGIGNAQDNTITGGDGNDYLNGGFGMDTLYGGAGDDYLYGGSHSDTLYGGDGNDILNGAGGADYMVGGAGDDIYYISNPLGVALENADEGTDTVLTFIGAYTLPENIENLTFTGSVSFTGTGNALANVITGGSSGDTLSGGAGNDTIYGGFGLDTLYGGDGDDTLNGGAQSDTLYGGAGNDVLNGEGGADYMVGGTGNDTYYISNPNGVALEYADEGIDTVMTFIGSYTLPDNVENLIYTGYWGFTGTGNALDNVITGGVGYDIIYGGDGNDTIEGGFGRDTLYGGDGDDVLDGGANPDVLIGGNGNDVLNGGGGADYMVGGAGDDTYYISNPNGVALEYANEGTDTVLTFIGYYILPENVENLTFTGSVDFTGIGNAQDNTITGGDGNDYLNGGFGMDTLYGGAGDDYLYGGSHNDTLYGGDGNDVLNGAGGADYMVGGAGDDVYYISNPLGVALENADEGTDTVYTFIDTYTLADNVENLTFTGSVGFTGTGNALANVITGGSSNDTLSGGDGNDTVYGGYGDDILTGGAGLDHLFGGSGSDKFVFTSITDAGVGATRDVIEDFESGDLIDLSSIDADTINAGDQAFTYIGAAAFAGVAGSLRYVDGILSGDVDGDTVVDFEIQLANAHTLGANDFIL